MGLFMKLRYIFLLFIICSSLFSMENEGQYNKIQSLQNLCVTKVVAHIYKEFENSPNRLDFICNSKDLNIISSRLLPQQLDKQIKEELFKKTMHKWPELFKNYFSSINTELTNKDNKFTLLPIEAATQSSFSGDGNQLAIRSNDTIFIVDIKSDVKNIDNYRKIRINPETTTIKLNYNGNKLATIGSALGNTCHILDSMLGHQIYRFSPTTVSSICFDSNDTLCALTHNRYKIALYQMKNWHNIANIDSCDNKIESMAFDNENRLIAATSDYIYSFKTDHPLNEPEKFFIPGSNPVISADGSHWITKSYERNWLKFGQKNYILLINSVEAQIKDAKKIDTNYNSKYSISSCGSIGIHEISDSDKRINTQLIDTNTGHVIVTFSEILYPSLNNKHLLCCNRNNKAALIPTEQILDCFQSLSSNLTIKEILLIPAAFDYKFANIDNQKIISRVDQSIDHKKINLIEQVAYGYPSDFLILNHHTIMPVKSKNILLDKISIKKDVINYLINEISREEFLFHSKIKAITQKKELQQICLNNIGKPDVDEIKERVEKIIKSHPMLDYSNARGSFPEKLISHPEDLFAQKMKRRADDLLKQNSMNNDVFSSITKDNLELLKKIGPVNHLKTT